MHTQRAPIAGSNVSGGHGAAPESRGQAGGSRCAKGARCEEDALKTKENPSGGGFTRGGKRLYKHPRPPSSKQNSSQQNKVPPTDGHVVVMADDWLANAAWLRRASPRTSYMHQSLENAGRWRLPCTSATRETTIGAARIDRASWSGCGCEQKAAAGHRRCSTRPSWWSTTASRSSSLCRLCAWCERWARLSRCAWSAGLRHLHRRHMGRRSWPGSRLVVHSRWGGSSAQPVHWRCLGRAPRDDTQQRRAEAEQAAAAAFHPFALGPHRANNIIYDLRQYSIGI